MRTLVLFAALLTLPSTQLPAQNTAKKAASKKGAKKSAKKTPAPKPGASSQKKKSAKKTSGKKRTRRPVRSTQQAPTPERYKQIQQALADRGYLQGTPTGTWGPEAVDSLKRFQQDQNLNPTGKIDSLSLIALGLGPKRANATPPKAQP